MNDFSNENIIIYHEQYPIAICKPDHLGFMGVYLKKRFLGYPVGTRVDVGLVGHEKNDIKEERVPMIVNKSGFEGTGLRLKSFERETVNKWKNLIQSIKNPLLTERFQ